jgi:large subunit ribosomal protein L13
MKTYSPKPEHIERRWYVLDAGGHVLGRVATEAAALLRGKHKPIFAPHMDTGDHVIIVNVDKIELTGNKGRDKYAYRHSGYPGGITAVPYAELMATRPAAAVEKAVRGMLPKNRLGRQLIKKLHVVAGPEHPHEAQKPVALQLGERPMWEGLPAPATTAEPTKTTKRTPAAEPTSESEGGDEPTATAPKQKSPARKPTARKPTAKSAAKSVAKPAAKKPTAKKPTAKKPTAKKTVKPKAPSAESEE